MVALTVVIALGLILILAPVALLFILIFGNKGIKLLTGKSIAYLPASKQIKLLAESERLALPEAVLLWDELSAFEQLEILTKMLTYTRQGESAGYEGLDVIRYGANLVNEGRAVIGKPAVFLGDMAINFLRVVR
jgi:hypothetical protein